MSVFPNPKITAVYRGRIAPSPTGYLHAGHAATFWTCWKRCTERQGTLVFRMEDLDPVRCRPEFAKAAIEDLRQLGIHWQEGPDCGGPFAPYSQSERKHAYLSAWKSLLLRGCIYPTRRTRKEMSTAPLAPHSREPLFPKAWRTSPEAIRSTEEPGDSHWRFRVPDGRRISFQDGFAGEYASVAGVDFGDFPVWRKDGVPSYELAVVVDDAAMRITEVVRAEDLLLSTCRQLLLYEALSLRPPAFFHVPLVVDNLGRRLAKREGALSLRELLSKGKNPLCIPEVRDAIEKAASASL